MLSCLTGVCSPGEAHRPDVRLQEAGQESSEEERRREAGPYGEADPGEGQQRLHCEPGLRLPKQNPPVSGHDPNVWRRPQVPHL